MADFNRAYKRTMGIEGRWVNNPRDRGGETYKGISRNNWDRWSGWTIIDGVKNNMKRQPDFGTAEYWAWVKFLNGQLAGSPLLQNAVAEFYRARFWGSLELIADQRVAEEVFDKAVNCGPVAYRWLQRAVKVAADGNIGPVTATAVNAADPSAVLDSLNEQCKHYYDQIIERDPDQECFRASWYARLKNYDDSPFVA